MQLAQQISLLSVCSQSQPYSLSLAPPNGGVIPRPRGAPPAAPTLAPAGSGGPQPPAPGRGRTLPLPLPSSQAGEGYISPNYKCAIKGAFCSSCTCGLRA